MPDLSVKYLGMQLRNPLIVASSGLTRSVKLIEQCENAGAGAVVMKSIFEEDIRRKDKTFSDPLLTHTEAAAYMDAEVGLIYGAQDYCDQIKEAKDKVGIPVIASVNCGQPRWWGGYAGQLEASGADAIELNLSVPSVAPEVSSTDSEQTFVDIVTEVRSKVKIPLAVKMSGQLTAPLNVAHKLVKAGADALVVFNRQSGLDIDLETGRAFSAKGDQGLSTSHSIYYPLRWVALLHDSLPETDISASGGVHGGEALVKYLLAGAGTVQVCSLLYRKGLRQIPLLLSSLEHYMRSQGVEQLDKLIGSVNRDIKLGSREQQRLEYLELAKGHYLEVDSTDGDGLIYEQHPDDKN
ncbi:dihydroorotate dehydrogenase-like protein [Gemmatimonadota bacterium]